MASFVIFARSPTPHRFFIGTFIDSEVYCSSCSLHKLRICICKSEVIWSLSSPTEEKYCGDYKSILDYLFVWYFFNIFTNVDIGPLPLPVCTCPSFVSYLMSQTYLRCETDKYIQVVVSCLMSNVSRNEKQHIIIYLI